MSSINICTIIWVIKRQWHLTNRKKAVIIHRIATIERRARFQKPVVGTTHDGVRIIFHYEINVNFTAGFANFYPTSSATATLPHQLRLVYSYGRGCLLKKRSYSCRTALRMAELFNIQLTGPALTSTWEIVVRLPCGCPTAVLPKNRANLAAKVDLFRYWSATTGLP